MNLLANDREREFLHLLERRGRRRRFGAGEEIFAEGERADYLPVVLNGKVKMVRYPELGKEIIIGMFEPGAMFAVPPVFDGAPYPATAVAMEETELLLLHRADFLSLLGESPKFSMEVIAWMCEMLREKTSVIKNLAIASPEQRVGNILVRLASKEDAGRPARISLRRQDIAEMAGLTTETTIRTVRKLAARNLIRIVHGKIFIDDVEDLKGFLE